MFLYSMWATYHHDRVDPIRDGRVFTNYTPDSIQQTNRITNNESYRQFLVENAESIIRENYSNVAKGNDHPTFEQVNHGTPFVFTMEEPNPKPKGYEDTITKQMYLTRAQLDEKKRRLLKEDY